MNNKYKDMHNHILYGIDDGANNIAQSVSILKKMEMLGYDEVIFTPHYIENTKFNANNEKKNYLINEIRNLLKEENINIKLYTGNEVFADINILELLKKEEIVTLNNSKYILIEFNRDREYIFYKGVVTELVNNGYVPIIAHPERYKFFENNDLLINEYLDLGALFQGNIKSITGTYGEGSRALFIHFLKNKYYSFLSTDIHLDEMMFLNFDAMKEKILEYITDDYCTDLTYNNIGKVINNEDVN